MLFFQFLLHELQVTEKFSIDARSTTGLLHWFESGSVQLVQEWPTPRNGEIDALVDCDVIQSLDHASNIPSVSNNKEFLSCFKLRHDLLIPVLISSSEDIMQRFCERDVLLRQTHHLVTNV